ncbi:hypothetical protein L6164_012897 [Bauhinia variegata]|uniref:Uncharacterized protein n=1 Tax=Bauhinia variegata TaxID=167791 RepID=A0ACB9PAY7_BAUVA|nr:hypothetical protein L6164_012897 [Bauhinia variegata]
MPMMSTHSTLLVLFLGVLLFTSPSLADNKQPFVEKKPPHYLTPSPCRSLIHCKLGHDPTSYKTQSEKTEAEQKGSTDADNHYSP